MSKSAPCQPTNNANAARNTIWLHTKPRHPNTRVSANRMAGLYAMVGGPRPLHIDPSTTPNMAAPTIIAIRIRRSAARRKRPRSKAVRAILGILQRNRVTVCKIARAPRTGLCHEAPTSVRLMLSNQDVLNEGFLARMRQKVSHAGETLKRALAEVWGVIDLEAGPVYIDKSVLVVKQTFLKLQEIAHAVLPWQGKLYAVVEDCEKTLAPEASEQFDREANAFASEVLFSTGRFHSGSGSPAWS